MSENLMIFPRNASCPLVQESIRHLCHYSQAFLSTAASTVLFLNPLQSSLMILCHATMLLLSSNVPVVTLPFHYFLLQS